jgi:hypothetical protein
MCSRDCQIPAKGIHELLPWNWRPQNIAGDAELMTEKQVPIRNTDAVMGAILIIAPEDPGPAIGASACELRHGIMHFYPAHCTMNTKA